MNILDDERKLSDNQFLSQIRDDFSGLEDCRTAANQGNLKDARSAFVLHFLNRSEPKWYFDWRNGRKPKLPSWDRRFTWGTPQIASLEERAAALLRNRFIDCNGESHDISNLETFPKYKLRQSLRSLQIICFIWAADLGEMYARTHDTRYAQKLAEIFEDFHRAFYMTVAVSDPDSLYLNDRVLPPWHWMNVGKAVGNMLIALYTGVLGDPVMKEHIVFLFLKKLWLYAAQFTRLTNVESYRRGNMHWYVRGACPFTFGMMLPEFCGFEEMRERGREVINLHMERDFLEDHTYFEHSISYSSAALGWDTLMPMISAYANRYKLLEDAHSEVLTHWLTWFASMTRPDGVLPAIGDEYESPAFQILARGAALLKDESLRGATEVAGNAHGQLDIEEVLADAYAALSPRLKAISSSVFPEGGWVALRSPIGETPMYLNMSAIRPPLGHAHGHWDLLSFQVFARGRSYIADPASRIYPGHFTGERQGYLVSMESHNVLTIDGDTLASKLRLCAHDAGDPPRCTIDTYKLHEKYDFVSAYHDGYAPIRHWREVLRVKDRYFLIIDRIEAQEPNWIHTYRRRLHFDYGVSASEQNGYIVATCGDQALTVIPMGCSNAERSKGGHQQHLRCGAEELSLFQDEYLRIECDRIGIDELPWVAVLKDDAAGAACFAMLLLPHARGAERSATVTSLSVKADGESLPPNEALALKVDTDHGTDIIYRRFGSPVNAQFSAYECRQDSLLVIGEDSGTDEYQFAGE